MHLDAFTHASVRVACSMHVKQQEGSSLGLLGVNKILCAGLSSLDLQRIIIL